MTTRCRNLLIFLLALASPSTYAHKDCHEYFKELEVGLRVDYRDAKLFVGKVSSFRPTQSSVGMYEVESKVHDLKKLMKHPKRLNKYLEQNPIPVVIGPQDELYIIDHHHLARALDELGIPKCYYAVVADRSQLNPTDFWYFMQEKKWVYLTDQNGKTIPLAHLPTEVSALQNDPYRSLAWLVREAGGYEKVAKPFAEFEWADFFRERIRISEDPKTIKNALDEALALAHSDAASELPGYLKK